MFLVKFWIIDSYDSVFPWIDSYRGTRFWCLCTENQIVSSIKASLNDVYHKVLLYWSMCFPYQTELCLSKPLHSGLWTNLRPKSGHADWIGSESTNSVLWGRIWFRIVDSQFLPILPTSNSTFPLVVMYLAYVQYAVLTNCTVFTI